MTRIRPPPFLPPALLKVLPSLAPTHLSKLSDPPHLFNLIRRHGYGITGKYVAQRRRIVQTGIADLYYQITRVDVANNLPSGVVATILYRGYPVHKKPRPIPTRDILNHTWDFVSSRGRMLKGSDFEREREGALKESGVLEMVKKLEPAPDIGRERAREPAVQIRGASAISRVEEKLKQMSRRPK